MTEKTQIFSWNVEIAELWKKINQTKILRNSEIISGNIEELFYNMFEYNRLEKYVEGPRWMSECGLCILAGVFEGKRETHQIARSMWCIIRKFYRIFTNVPLDLKCHLQVKLKKIAGSWPKGLITCRASPNAYAQSQNECTIEFQLLFFLHHMLQSMDYFIFFRINYYFKFNINLPWLMASSNIWTFPERFINTISLPSFESIAKPAESYPRYSKRFKPVTSRSKISLRVFGVK